MLRAMFKWAGNYDSGKDDLKARVAQFEAKLLTLRGNAEIREYLKSLQQSS
jgi:hypothetical protein